MNWPIRWARKIEKLLVFTCRGLVSPVSPRLCTKLLINFYRRNGMCINGIPNYVSAKSWFDGTDYARIELNEGCTISSYARILTHDWSLDTVVRGMGLKPERWLGNHGNVRIGEFAFVGHGVILLPGANVGNAALLGAGSVVRGKVPDYAIFVGNPAQQVGDTRVYANKHLKRLGEEELAAQLKKHLLQNGE